MRLLITSEAHFSRVPTGEISVEGPAKYSFWSSALETFDEVSVLARVGLSKGPSPEGVRADGPSVSFRALPDYRGPWQYFRSIPGLRETVRHAIAESDAYLLRVPGLVGRLAWQEITRLKKPYALEVVGDPWDALGPGTWPSLFRPVFRRTGARELKLMCQGASAVHYVTEGALQRRYPAGPRTYTTVFPNVSTDLALASAATLDQRTRRLVLNKPLRIGFIGSLAQLYKGPDVLLRAASLCSSSGRNFELIMVGDGRYFEQMKALASRLGVEDRTQFISRLPFGKAIFEFLDSIDLFVMPSRAEGLPRALVEAMARGCPCIGSDVGGIPELLAAEDLVPPNDHKALARRILEVASDLHRMKTMSVRNLAKAKQFDPEALRDVRRAFYNHVRIHSRTTGSPAACKPHPSE